MPKNDRIEIKVSSDVRQKYEEMHSELALQLRKRLGRRVCGEDVIMAIVDAYRRDPGAFIEQSLSKAQFK